MVYGHAQVLSNAMVYGHVMVSDNAIIYSDAQVYGNALIYGNAQVYGLARVYGDAQVFGYTRVYGDAQVCDDARVYGNAEICGYTMVKSDKDYAVFKNFWSSGRYFTWTRSNDMWKVGCFYGTGEELIKKAYKDSKESGDKYKAIVKAMEVLK